MSEEVVNGFTLFAQEVQAEAEHDGKEDDLKDGALSKSFHRVDRGRYQVRFARNSEPSLEQPSNLPWESVRTDTRVDDVSN